MSDIKDLLDEAVGSYEPRADQRAVEERVERRKQRRRLAASSVALAVFVLAGWFAWTAFRPGGATVGSTGSGTYVLSDFEVLPHIKRDSVAPGPADVDPTQADVTFATRWSSNMYPGDHSCTMQVFDPAGAQIGSVSVEMASLLQDNVSSIPIPVTGPIEGATATGSCGPERLDTPIAYEITDVRLMDDLTVSYVAGWPDSLGEGGYPGTNACTIALFQNGDLVARKHLTLAVGDKQEVTSTQFSQFNDQIVLVPPSSLDATVVCAPYVSQGVYPDPKPPARTAGTSPDPYPRGAFEWCPGPPFPDGGLDWSEQASAAAQRFVGAYAAGDDSAVAELLDSSVPPSAEFPIELAPGAESSVISTNAAGGPLVEFACGIDAAAHTVAVTMDDGSESASLDFIVYLVLREDGWKVWAVY